MNSTHPFNSIFIGVSAIKSQEFSGMGCLEIFGVNGKKTTHPPPWIRGLKDIYTLRASSLSEQGQTVHKLCRNTELYRKTKAYCVAKIRTK